MNVLVIAAHPDDEILGGGGTFARLAEEGHNVYLSILGEGMTSRSAQREDTSSEVLEGLHGDARRAAEVIGAKDLFQYQLPDNRFDSVPLLEVIKIVEELVERVQPEVVYTHHQGDLNVDHQVLHQAVLTGTRPMEGCGIREVYAFEIPSSTEWALQRIPEPFRPNVFVEITDTLEKKIQAMECYETELRPYPHPRSRQALDVIARRWGTVCGCAAAEAFELVRSVRLK